MTKAKTKTEENYGRDTIVKTLQSVVKGTDWRDTHNFQEDIIQNASRILTKRIVGWLEHKNLWEINVSGEAFNKAFIRFEKEHLHAYKRWKKVSQVKNYATKVLGKLQESEKLQDRLTRMFIYYLVYGELHEFRNAKSVLHLFYHICLHKIAAGEQMVGDWIRKQAKVLYQLVGLVYSNTEMNQDCFHHDDLDDLCSSKKFLSERFFPSCDFMKAFDVHDVKDGPFIDLSKVMQLQTNVFVKYWLKSAQASLSEADHIERNKWIRKEFFREDHPELKKLDEELATVEAQLLEAQRQLEEAQQNTDKTDRYKAEEREISDPQQKLLFRKAHLRFETVKPFISYAESRLTAARLMFNDAKNKYWKDNANAKTSFEAALSKYEEAQVDWAEARRGFTSASAEFSRIIEFGDNWAKQADYYLAKTNLSILRTRKAQLYTKMTMILQLGYVDVINKSRERFAQRWKTFFERAGGPGGISGYLTIFRHYSAVIYLHLFLVFPLGWLYFGYHNLIHMQTLKSDILHLLSPSNVLHPAENVLVVLFLSFGLMILFGLMNLLWLRHRTAGYSAPRRDKGQRLFWNIKSWIGNLVLWIIVLVIQILIFEYLVLQPIKGATNDFMSKWHPIETPILLIIHWVPTLALYFSSMQFVYTIWIAIFGWIYGYIDGVAQVRTWSQIISAFEPTSEKGLPLIVERFRTTMLPKRESPKKAADPSDLELGTTTTLDHRDHIAFAKVWNTVIDYFYDIHKLSKEETQRLSFSIKRERPEDFLSGEIEKFPDFNVEPKSKDVRYHLIRFVNNILNTNKPKDPISIKEMLPLTIVTPVANEKILYPYEYITHIDNTQNSFLLHLLQTSPEEWENFKAKECTHPKALDYINRLQKDIFQGAQPDQSPKRWIHSHRDGVALKLKICEWASLRFQALYRTINGFMQVPKVLQIMARIESPMMTQLEAEELARQKFSYLIGYQPYGTFQRLYRSTHRKSETGAVLTKQEMEAHDAVYNIKVIHSKYPDILIAYPDYDEGRFIGRLENGDDATESVSYAIELFGPIEDYGLGKPVNQNFMSQFIDGLIVQTIDVNQDSVISQAFFVPNLLAEFEDKNVKIVGVPEYITTTNWSTTAWCSAWSEHTFGTLLQRVYARLGVRLHYGHPDYINALWIMTETGLSKLSYVSEDIFTGIDTIIKGGNIVHVEYHEVGKARDVDLYTTTKFIRKISMGASQLACTRYTQQMQTSANVNFFQALSLYYSGVGFYFNHFMLYVSIWFTLVSQAALVVVQGYIFGSTISSYLASRVYSFQAALALVAPGVFQLILEFGILIGFWQYISRIFILAIYSTFHILNTAAYWQWGLTKTAFYLASGRGGGLEHYFMKDMYHTFYKTHWKPGFFIMWLGLIVLILSGNFVVFFVLYFLPAAIWLWGASFLNPGALPTTVHEEQWKRLVNRDMQETREVIKEHVKFPRNKPLRGNLFRKLTTAIGRGVTHFFKTIHWVYTVINFTVHMRVTRLIAMIAMIYELILAPAIPTYIFTDERRRILRWEEEEGRYRSAFFGSSFQDKHAININTSKSSSGLSSSSSGAISNSPNTPAAQVKKSGSEKTILHASTDGKGPKKDRIKFQ